MGLKGESAIYATFACVRCHRDGDVEYSLAGHGPILHYQNGVKAATELGLTQFPLGMFDNASYDSLRTQIGPGDILVLLTDGMTEVTNTSGDEFGLHRFKSVLEANVPESLASLLTLLFMRVRQHGPQADDQTVVLVRRASSALTRTSPEASPNVMSTASVNRLRYAARDVRNCARKCA